MDLRHLTLHQRLICIAVIALAYLLTARLGFLAALPPGNVTALWAPSGIALAAVLLVGGTALPGIWLGSFLINAWSLHSLTGFWVAVVIASGSSVQAYVAATVLQKVLGATGLPRQGRDVASFMALTALTTVIAASAGVLALCIATFADWSAFPRLWWTWWLGDYAGILSFAPLLIVFGRRWLYGSSAEIELFPLTTLWFGITLIAFFFVYQMEQRALLGSTAPVSLRPWLLLVFGFTMNALVTLYINQRQRADMAVREREARIRRLFDDAPDAVLVVDIKGAILNANNETEKLFGYKVEELIGQPVHKLLPERFRSQHPEFLARFFNAPTRRRLGGNRRLVGQHKDGHEIPLDIMLSPVVNGGLPQAIAIIRDVSERVQAEEQIRELNTTLEARVAERTATLEQEVLRRENVENVLKQAHQELQQSVQQLASRNREISLLREMTEFLDASADIDEAIAAVSRFLPFLFEGAVGAIYLQEDGQHKLRSVWGDLSKAVVPAFAGDDCWGLRRGKLYRCTSQTTVPCKHIEVPEPLPFHYICTPVVGNGELLGLLHLRFAPMTEVGAQAHENLLSDVAEQFGLVLANLRLRETLRNQAMRDPLTQLYNRRHLELALERELRRCERNAEALVVAMVDIDHFKKFNDTHGHAAGDLVLTTVAKLFRDNVRASDIVCRYGGEEFLLLLPDSTRGGASARLETLRQKVQQLQLHWGPQILPPLTISIGIASFPEQGSAPLVLVAAADKALYRAKSEGRNRICIAD